MSPVALKPNAASASSPFLRDWTILDLTEGAHDAPGSASPFTPENTGRRLILAEGEPVWDALRIAANPGAVEAVAISGVPLCDGGVRSRLIVELNRVFKTGTPVLVAWPREEDGRPMDEIAALRALDCEHACLTVWSPAGDVTKRGLVRRWLEELDAPKDGKLRLPTKVLGADLTGWGEIRALERVVATRTLFRHYGPGKPFAASTLERELERRLGVAHALGTTSGSAALNCAIIALGVGPGDEVLLPAFSWFSCYNAIVLAGATPIFCEIDDTLNLDPAEIARKATPKTKAVIVVHYQGGPARMDEIIAAARASSLRVVEDCAQAIGATYRGRPVGTLGDVGIYSFQGNKIICAGEGGALVTNDPALYERAVRFHDLGSVRPAFRNVQGGAVADPWAGAFAGNQYRMSELTAAVVLAQLGRLDWIAERCRASSARLRAQLAAALPWLRFRAMPDAEGDLGITVFLNLGDAAWVERVYAALKLRGFSPGPSSGMVNLLHLEYVNERRQAVPAMPPFGPGQPAEGRRQIRQDAPRTDGLIAGMAAVGIGPRYKRSHVDQLAFALVEIIGDTAANET